MAIIINRITNCNVYLDGASMLGRAEEIDLPEVKQIMQEHKALGMQGKVEFPAGIDKLEAKIKWNSFYPEVLRKIGNPFKSLQLQARGSLESYTGQGRTSEVPVVTLMTGIFKKFPLGKFKPHDNVELESELAIHYVKQTIDGQDIIEIDVLANIFRIGTGDLLERFRINIGG